MGRIGYDARVRFTEDFGRRGKELGVFVAAGTTGRHVRTLDDPWDRSDPRVVVELDGAGVCVTTVASQLEELADQTPPPTFEERVAAFVRENLSAHVYEDHEWGGHTVQLYLGGERF